MGPCSRDGKAPLVAWFRTATLLVAGLRARSDLLLIAANSLWRCLRRLYAETREGNCRLLWCGTAWSGAAIRLRRGQGAAHAAHEAQDLALQLVVR